MRSQRSVDPGLKPWSSEAYFREAPGRWPGWCAQKIGDPDDLLLARLTLRDLQMGEDPARTPPYKRMPELLDKEWDEYLIRFAAHYGLEGERLEIAQKVLQQEKDQTVIWLTVKPGTVMWRISGLWTDLDRTPFKRTYPGGSYEVNISVAERVEEYRHKLEEYRSLQKQNTMLRQGRGEGPPHSTARRGHGPANGTADTSRQARNRDEEGACRKCAEQGRTQGGHARAGPAEAVGDSLDRLLDCAGC